ncbi:methionine adenosyltransferase [Thomasclavelia cocleata]|uniref:methionine adenosyltransferase n=1 Tax=Thomasclavelia cocleata TaxID=69824 RepID=UPI0024332DE9|nr:methionine adenosyltransferase [Thomasclavelia cocleata]
MKEFYFTSESVVEGHPDKICDKIADSILDYALSKDKNSKMAVEASIKDNFILIFGEANTNCDIDYEAIAKKVLKDVGYNENYDVLVKVNEQSSEINLAVTRVDGEIAAGDQGIMFGFACDETDELMPAPIYYAHQLALKLREIHKKYVKLGPDGKTQVTVKYIDDKVDSIDSIIISTQHSSDLNIETIKEIILEEVIYPTIPKSLITHNTKYLINPSGSFILGGSFGDSGTTGRKIVCDTYGGYSRVGGGCFSSKDPSKVDRSAAYYCRYVAKSIVANNLAKKCEIGVSYAIGHTNPISIFVDTFGTSNLSDEELNNIISKNFNFSVTNIINELNLLKPIYAETSCYGHFGRKKFTWEKVKNLKCNIY